jgi:hypothetical protein
MNPSSFIKSYLYMTADDNFLEKPIMVEKYGRALSPISIASEQGNLRICQVLFDAGGGNLVQQ